MKRAFLYGLSGLAALIAVAAAVPLLIPASVYKDRIEAGVTRATGRKFTIAGQLHFTLFPALAIRADQIALTGLPEGQSPPVVIADDIQFGVRFWPLLSGRLELTRIVLDKPAITLAVTEDGRANWIFEHAPKTRTGKTESRFSIAPHFSDVEITQGTVRYVNARSGTKHEFENINANIRLTDFSQPATATGTFKFKGRDVSFRAKVATPRQLLSARNGEIEFALTSGSVSANFSGTVAPDGSVSGHLKAETSSLRDTAARLGGKLPDSDGFGALSFEATIQGDNRSISLNKLIATLDGTHIGGELRLTMDKPTPFAEGTLSIDRFDLNPYITHRHKSGIARRKEKADEWSDEPVSLDILKKANASLEVNAGSVTVRNLKLGKTSARVGLHDGVLNATLSPVSLYGGSGNALLSIDTSRSTPVFRNKLQFNNVALQPFFFDTIGVKQIEGIGTIKLDLTSAGANPRAIMHGLNGKGSIAFRDGRLRGVNLGAVARAAQTLLGGAINPDSFTSFTTMSGSFKVTNGVLRNQDFQLVGPVLKTTGSGAVDIGNRSIDFRIVPQATAIIAREKLTVGVPFRIKGPWRHVRYTADIAGMVNGILNNLETGKAPFKGLFGPSKPRDPNAPKKKHKNIGDALKNMLGIH